MAVVSLTPFNQHFQFGLPVSSQVYTKLLLRGRVRSGRVSQIGSRIPRRSPAVQVVLFQFFLFGGPAGYFPEARAPDRLYWCPQAKHNRARKYQIQAPGIHRKGLECHVHAKSAEGIIDPLLVALTRRTEIVWKK